MACRLFGAKLISKANEKFSEKHLNEQNVNENNIETDKFTVTKFHLNLSFLIYHQFFAINGIPWCWYMSHLSKGKFL